MRGAVEGAFVIAAALLLAGCSVPVAVGLEESDANRVVMALDRAGVDATKDVDPSAEGKFRIDVARDDAPRALAAMSDEELPRPKSKGVLDALDKGQLVPSQAAEHAQFVSGLAGDLERTLTSVDGVLSARVHLNVPEQNPLRDGAPERATASVLVEHRGQNPPMSENAVQRLVAGGVRGLAAENVAVVMVARAPRPAVRDSGLAHVGPIAVARGSVRPLQLGAATIIGLLLVFGVLTLLFYTRAARLRAELDAAAKK
jgi:type III secretion protein J